jgi:hypothetical protein
MLVFSIRNRSMLVPPLSRTPGLSEHRGARIAWGRSSAGQEWVSFSKQLTRGVGVGLDVLSGVSTPPPTTTTTTVRYRLVRAQQVRLASPTWCLTGVHLRNVQATNDRYERLFSREFARKPVRNRHRHHFGLGASRETAHVARFPRGPRQVGPSWPARNESGQLAAAAACSISLRL